jgi:hypothetical protein
MIDNEWIGWDVFRFYSAECVSRHRLSEICVFFWTPATAPATVHTDCGQLIAPQSTETQRGYGGHSNGLFNFIPSNHSYLSLSPSPLSLSLFRDQR